MRAEGYDEYKELELVHLHSTYGCFLHQCHSVLCSPNENWH
jgi:hypothetical protein